MIAPKWFYVMAGACIEGAIWCAALHFGALVAVFLGAAAMNWYTAEHRTDKE